MPAEKSWKDVIVETFRGAPPISKNWTNRDDMIRVLTPFMNPNIINAIMPMGGDTDLQAISISRAPDCPDCLEFCTNSSGDISFILFRPAALFFEYFPMSPQDSFFLIELNDLPPSGVNSANDDWEECIEIAPGVYKDAAHLQSGNLGCDAEGKEIQLPNTARHVVRILRGKILLFAKISIGNGLAWVEWREVPMRVKHNTMAAGEVRSMIQQELDRGK